MLAGSVAARSGVLQAGDVVHEINDNPITGWSIDQVAEYMVSIGTQHQVFKKYLITALVN